MVFSCFREYFHNRGLLTVLKSWKNEFLSVIFLEYNQNPLFGFPFFLWGKTYSVLELFGV